MTSTPPIYWEDWNLNYFPDAYGSLYGGQSVEEAIYRTIQTWLPAYIAEINRQLGGEVLQPVHDYRYRPENRTLSAKTTCAILVTVPGTQKVTRTNSGYRSTWNATIEVFVFGPKDWKVTQALTYAYGTAVRGAVVQHPALGGFAETTTWSSEEFTRGAEVSSARTSGRAEIKLLVNVSDTMDTWSDVQIPSLDAPPPVPVVDEFDIQLDKEEIGTDLSDD